MECNISFFRKRETLSHNHSNQAIPVRRHDIQIPASPEIWWLAELSTVLFHLSISILFLLLAAKSSHIFKKVTKKLLQFSIYFYCKTSLCSKITNSPPRIIDDWILSKLCEKSSGLDFIIYKTAIHYSCLM